MLHSPVFLELLILFGAAALVSTACHYLKFPTIIGFLLTGVIVGPSGFGLVSSLPNADFLAEIAGLFLMFTIGLEFSLKRLLKLRREFLRLGLLQVCLTVLFVGLISYWAFQRPWGQSVFIGFLLALSSTALVMKLLQDARDLDTPYGASSLSILLFQDIAVIPMMLLLPLLTEGMGGQLAARGSAILNWDSLRYLGLMIAILSFMWISTRYIVPTLLERIVATQSREIFFFFVLFFCLGVGYLFQWAGLSLSLGAFAAGLIISESPYGRQVTSDILPLRDNFLGLFFASVGMLLDLNFILENWFFVLLLGALGFFIKTFVVTLVAALNRFPLSLAAVMGLILCQVGEFSFILASRGQDLGLLDSIQNQYFLCVTVLSMAATPFLYRLTPFLFRSPGPLSWSFFGRSRESDQMRQIVSDVQNVGKKKENLGHAIIIGFGISGENVAAAFESLQIPFRVIELNHQTFKRGRRRGVDIHYGDATRPDVLEHVGIGSARLVVVTVSGSKVLPLVMTSIRHQRPDVQVIIRTQYVRDVEALHKEPQTEIVVAEIETSIEILARSLTVFGVSRSDIKRYMDQARHELHAMSQIKATLQSAALSLPSWEALGTIKPLRLDSGFAAIQRSILELDIRRQTGATIVAVFREGLGSTVPNGEFVFSVGDVIQLLGSPEALEQAEILLQTGTLKANL